MKLTRANIHAVLNNGAVNAKQLKLLGIAWPPQKGWLSQLIGKEISQADYDKLGQLRRNRKGKTSHTPHNLLSSSSDDLDSSAWL